MTKEQLESYDSMSIEELSKLDIDEINEIQNSRGISPKLANKIHFAIQYRVQEAQLSSLSGLEELDGQKEKVDGAVFEYLKKKHGRNMEGIARDQEIADMEEEEQDYKEELSSKSKVKTFFKQVNRYKTFRPFAVIASKISKLFDIEELKASVSDIKLSRIMRTHSRAQEMDLTNILNRAMNGEKISDEELRHVSQWQWQQKRVRKSFADNFESEMTEGAQQLKKLLDMYQSFIVDVTSKDLSHFERYTSDLPLMREFQGMMLSIRDDVQRTTFKKDNIPFEVRMKFVKRAQEAMEALKQSQPDEYREIQEYQRKKREISSAFSDAQQGFIMDTISGQKERTARDKKAGYSDEELEANNAALDAMLDKYTREKMKAPDRDVAGIIDEGMVLPNIDNVL